MSKPYGRILSLVLAVTLGVAAPLLAYDEDPASDTVDTGRDLQADGAQLEEQRVDQPDAQPGNSQPRGVR